MTNQSDITCFAQAVSKPSAVVGVGGSSFWWIVVILILVACGSEFGAAGEKLKPAAGQRIGHGDPSLSLPSWGFGNNGCDGGEDFRAYQVVFLL